jgi:hypothetical protein
LLNVSLQLGNKRGFKQKNTHTIYPDRVGQNWEDDLFVNPWFMTWLWGVPFLTATTVPLFF